MSGSACEKKMGKRGKGGGGESEVNHVKVVSAARAL